MSLRLLGLFLVAISGKVAGAVALEARHLALPVVGGMLVRLGTNRGRPRPWLVVIELLGAAVGAVVARSMKRALGTRLVSL